MSQVRYAFSGSTFVKMALGLAAAVAAMFALMGATSNPAQANPPAPGCSGLVVVCNNPISIIGGDVNVITAKNVLNNNQITIVKDVLNAKCGGIINVSCIDASLKALVLVIVDPKILSIVKI